MARKKILVIYVLISYSYYIGEFIFHTDASKTHIGGGNDPKRKYHFLLLTQVNPCKNQLYNYISITVKYSGKSKTILYHSIITPCIIIYGSRKSHV